MNRLAPIGRPRPLPIVRELPVRSRPAAETQTDAQPKRGRPGAPRRIRLSPQPTLTSASPFWTPSRHADRRPRLAARARLAALVRSHFAADGFLEVEPAALQASPGAEAHLHAFSTSMIGPDGVPRPAYLHTSPEFAMKKLLAAGERRIFALSRVFRNRERGVLHAPEFTMFEWYRAGEPLEALMADCAVNL